MIGLQGLLVVLGALASLVTVVEVIWRPFGKAWRRRRDLQDREFLATILAAGANSHCPETREEVDRCERLVKRKYMAGRLGGYAITERGRAVASADAARVTAERRVPGDG